MKFFGNLGPIFFFQERPFPATAAASHSQSCLRLTTCPPFATLASRSRGRQHRRPGAPRTAGDQQPGQATASTLHLQASPHVRSSSRRAPAGRQRRSPPDPVPPPSGSIRSAQGSSRQRPAQVRSDLACRFQSLFSVLVMIGSAIHWL